MTVPLAEQIAWATREHMYAETDLRNSPGASDYSVQCAASVLATLEAQPAMLAVIEAARAAEKMLGEARDWITRSGVARPSLINDQIAPVEIALRDALAALPSPPQE